MLKKNKKINLITGSAGFIGHHLAQSLLDDGEVVVGVDNFTLGHKKNIQKLKLNKNFYFFNHDLSKLQTVNDLEKDLKNFQIDFVWHLAANSDIRGFINGPEVDLLNTFQTTVNICKLVEKLNIKNLIFASSSAVLGNSRNPVSETFGPSLPISYYGASKLASEGYISSCTSYFLQNYIIFRFPNVIGPNLTHGIIYDFKKKLEKNPKALEVLGDGNQKKPYLYITDLIDAMKYYRDNNTNLLINISPEDDGITVKEIVKIVQKKFKNKPKISYEKKAEGWEGDVVKYSYDFSLQKKLGWKPKYSSLEAVSETVDLLFN